MSAPSKEQLDSIAKQAEGDLNSYQLKTGRARPNTAPDAGVNTIAENKFPGAEVRYGEDLTTEVKRGRERHPDAEADAAAQTERISGSLGPDHGARARDDGKDVLNQGQEASRHNVGGTQPATGRGEKFKGEDYYTPESVPDSISAEGRIPPASVVQASRETEGIR